jgi:uncharacterized protein YndB with AHSA1/START domain
MKNAGSLQITTPSDREIAVTRVFDAPHPLVFQVWTSPEHLPKWMLGPPGWRMPVCEIDFRPGGAWLMVWRQPDGKQMEMRGKYREIVPAERIVSSESWGGDWPETTNTVTLSEDHGRTTLTLKILYPSKQARDAALQTGMKEGMALNFNRMEEYLASQQAGAVKKRA